MIWNDDMMCDNKKGVKQLYDIWNDDMIWFMEWWCDDMIKKDAWNDNMIYEMMIWYRIKNIVCEMMIWKIKLYEMMIWYMQDVPKKDSNF